MHPYLKCTLILFRHVKCMRYLIRHVNCKRILFRHVKCLRYLIRHVKCMRILIRHVKCMGYFNSPCKMSGYFNSACKMCHLILTPKKRHRRGTKSIRARARARENHMKPFVRTSFLGTRPSCLPSPGRPFFAADDRKPIL